VIEVEVHQRLRAFLREQGKPYWSHHLTMARLVARALRLGRSALLQTDALSRYQGRYRLSYLVPVLLWQEPVILVVPEDVQQRLLMVEIPQLRQWVETSKPIYTGDRVPAEDFNGLLLTTPESWLRDRLHQEGRFPPGIPTILDGVDDLEQWVQSVLTVNLQPSDWEDLMLACPAHGDAIRDARVQLTKTIFQRPVNPYDCCLLEPYEQRILECLFEFLGATAPLPLLPPRWQQFQKAYTQPGQMLWADISRQLGQFSLNSSPIEVSSVLREVWEQQPVILVGGALDLDAEAAVYRQRLGLDDVTSVKFTPDRSDELIHLYLPERIPMPNTEWFQSALMQEMHTLLRLSAGGQGLTVLIVGDTPLKAQVGSLLAAEFGSRVQVERTCLDENGVLVTGWEFWQTYQKVLPIPQTIAIATLPIPSLEDPLIAGKVAYYKQHRLDWFRLFLFPEALNKLQRAIAPVRERQGVVALFDSRVVHRSYGQQVLTALNPFARVSYLEAGLFNQTDCSFFE